jgi:hypothetical protein
MFMEPGNESCTGTRSRDIAPMSQVFSSVLCDILSSDCPDVEQAPKSRVDAQSCKARDATNRPCAVVVFTRQASSGGAWVRY